MKPRVREVARELDRLLQMLDEGVEPESPTTQGEAACPTTSSISLPKASIP
jgi:hypothetical protein